MELLKESLIGGKNSTYGHYKKYIRSHSESVCNFDICSTISKIDPLNCDERKVNTPFITSINNYFDDLQLNGDKLGYEKGENIFNMELSQNGVVEQEGNLQE